MARRVFFSFEYDHDVWRANVVRNSWVTQDRQAAGFYDAAEFEQIKRGGDTAIQRWIDGQLVNTSVTVVLVGAYTCSSRWVHYEIEASKIRGNGLLGVNISTISDVNGFASTCCGMMPAGYPFYDWSQGGYQYLGYWIEQAAQAAGR